MDQQTQPEKVPLSDLDKEAIREAVLQAARSGHRVSGLAQELIDEMRVLKTGP